MGLLLDDDGEPNSAASYLFGVWSSHHQGNRHNGRS